MMVLLHHLRKCFGRNILRHRVYAGSGPFKNFLGLQAVVGFLYIFFILHHPLHIIVDPGLVFAHLAAHITEELLLRECAYLIGVDLDGIVLDDLVGYQRPF